MCKWCKAINSKCDQDSCGVQGIQSTHDLVHHAYIRTKLIIE